MPCAPRIESDEVGYHAGMLGKAVKPGNVRRHLRALARIGTETALKAMVVEGIGSKRLGVAKGAKLKSPEKRARELASAGIIPAMEGVSKPIERMSIAAEELGKLGNKGLRAIAEHGFPVETGIWTNVKNRNLARNSIAVLSVMSLKNPKAAEVLAKRGMRYPYPEIAKEAIARLAVAKENGLLIEHGLTHERDDVQREAMDWLVFNLRRGHISKKDMRKLGWYITEGSPEHAMNAINVLMYSASRNATKPLIKYGLKSGNATHIIASATALGWTKDERAVKPLVKYGLKSDSYNVAKAAVHGLHDIKSRRAISALIRHGLKHSEPSIVEATAKALAEIGDRRALPHLMAYADHPNKNVREEVKKAIRKIRGAKHA
jgi:hypothetical protein